MATTSVDTRIQSALHNLRETLGAEAIADLLEQFARSAATSDPRRTLTHEQEAVLASGGMPPVEMPAFDGRASTQTLQAYTHLAAEAYTGEEVAHMLGVGASRVRQHINRRTLLTIKTEDGPRFPRFQFANGRILPGWQKVAPHFPSDVHPVAVVSFLERPHTDLEIPENGITGDSGGAPTTPLQWLASGGDPSVVADLVDAAYLIG